MRSAMGRGGRGYEIQIFHLVCIALLSAFTGACGKILGVDGYSVGGGPRSDAGGSSTPGSEFYFVDTECGKCMRANCAAKLAECRNDTLCGPWQSCMAKCPTGDGDNVCQHKCFKDAGATNEKMGEAAVCSGQFCLDTCKNPAGGAAYSSTCGEASLKQCDQQNRACYADPDCRGFFTCLFWKNCLIQSPSATIGAVAPNPSCIWQCGDPHGLYTPARPDGGVAANPTLSLVQCLYATAYQGCGFDNLACAGRYTWPPPSTGTSQVSVSLYVSDSVFPESPGTPLGGVSIRACAQLSSTCSPPSVITDTSGQAPKLFLPTDSIGDRWYFEATPPATSNWLNGPSRILFNTGRTLTQDTLIPLAMDAADFSNLIDGAPVRGLVWHNGNAAVSVWMRTCDNSLAKGLEVRLQTPDGGTTARPSYGTGVSFRSTPCGIGACPNPTIAALFYDVEPGSVTVSAWDVSTEVATRVAEEVVITKADSVTILNWLEPLRSP